MRVWVALSPPALIFLLSCSISSERADSFSLRSSEQATMRSTTSLRSCLASGRLASSVIKHFSTNWRSDSEYLMGSSEVNYRLTMTFARSRGLLPEKAALRHISSCKMHPKLQISAFSLQSCLCTISGAEQATVPTNDCPIFFTLALLMLLASPKSVTFMLNLLSIMMLEGLRSLWMIFFYMWRYRSTDRMQMRIFQTISSSNNSAFSFWLRMSSERLHPLMTSITMQRQPSSKKDSQNLTMLGCLSSLQILTSLESSSISSLFSLMSSTLIRFNAYSLTPFLARNTLPKAPCPSSSSKLQFPTTCSLQFLLENSLASFSYSSSMASTLLLSMPLNTYNVRVQLFRGFTKCPTSMNGISSSFGNICLKIFRLRYRDEAYRSSRRRSSLNSSKASASSVSSMSSNLMTWQLAGCERTSKAITSSMPSSMNLELMSLSSMRCVKILMVKISSLQFMGSLSLRLMREVKLLSLKSQMASVLVVSSSLQMQLRMAILSMMLFVPPAVWHLLSSAMSVGTPLILLKFSLKCLMSRRSLMRLTSLGLAAASVRSSANRSLPTYQTSSSTWCCPWEVSSRVISMMILLISGLFMTSRSRIVLNISSLTSFGDISMYRRCIARISTITCGWEDSSAMASLRRYKNYGLRLARSSGPLVSIRRSCRYLT